MRRRTWTAGIAAASAICVVAATAFAAPGDLDRTFGGDGVVTRADFAIDEVTVDSRGRALAAGQVEGDWSVLRYLPDGRLDPSFGGGDGVAAAGDPAIADLLLGIARDAQGRIYLGGQGVNGGDIGLGAIRFTASGARDMSYGGVGGDPAGWAYTDTGPDSYIGDITIDAQGRLVASTVVGNNPLEDVGAARYLPSGDEDDSFSGDGWETAGNSSQAFTDSVEVDPQSRVLVIAYNSGGPDSDTGLLVRFRANGSLDPSFNTTGRALIDVPGADTVLPQGGEILPSGRIVVSGWQSTAPDAAIALYSVSNSGQLDNTFGGDGIALLDPEGGFNATSNTDLSVDRQGRFVVGVRRQPEGIGPSDPAAARFRANGTPDPGFGQGGLAIGPTDDGFFSPREAAIDPRSGRILTGGAAPMLGWLARFEALPRCGGKVPTVAGGPGKNKLRGTKKADVIAGGAGNDVISGRGGKDVLCGEAGRDRLLGGGGRDRLLGGKGRDRLLGGPGRDVLKGGPGRDRQNQ